MDYEQIKDIKFESLYGFFSKRVINSINKWEIIYLKEKYNMDLGVDFVLTINSYEMPYFKLTTDQMAFLQAVGADVEVFLYDYTK